MKKYDFERAQEFIEEEKKKGLISATFGMYEDWDWTAEEIWNKEDLYSMSFRERNIAGIDGSTWATPYLSAEYEDRVIDMPMYVEDGEKVSKEQIEMQKQFAALTGGRSKE